MNAVTPILTPYALEQAELLRHLAGQFLPETQTALAAAVGRDLSNLRRTLSKLADEGFTALDDDKRPCLTDQGRRAVEALGRLAEDAPPADTDPRPSGVIALRADEIAFDGDNARQTSGLSDPDIEEMALSIREHGLLTPPIVRRLERAPNDARAAEDGGAPDWVLVAGERRLRGWRLAIEFGWIGADTRYLCQVFDGDDLEASEAALVENILRVDLDNLEVAEGLLKLSRKSEPPATAPQLARRLGKTGESGERWVQERLRVAQEASAADKQRYRDWQARKAAAGEAYRDEADPDVFRWTDLRNSVKKAKHLTALEKNPRLALLVVELALASDAKVGIWDGFVATRAPPPGGIVDQAEQLGLVEYVTGFGPAMRLTQPACDWLAAEGFGEDFEIGHDLLTRTRTAALGAMGALAVPAGQWATDFLNLPPEPQTPPDTQASPTLRPGLTGDAFSLQIRALREEAGDAEAGPPAGAIAPGPASNEPPAGALPPDGRQAAEAADEAAQTDPGDTPPPGSNPDPLDALSPLARLALLELALATRTQGIDARQGGLRGPRLYDFHLDPSGTWAELYAGKWAYPGQGPGGWLAVMTQKALDALAATFPAGITAIDLDAEMTSAGVTTIRDDWFAPWLNPPATAAPSSSPTGGGGPPPQAGVEGVRTDAGQAPEPRSAQAEAREAVAQVGDVIVGGMRRALAQLHAEATRAQALLRDIEGHEAREGQVLSADLWPRLTGVLAGLSVGLQDATPYLPKEQG